MQRLRGLIPDTHSTNTIIWFLGLVLLLMIVLPQALPFKQYGVACSILANPIPGGNNQSLLSTRSEGALRLEINLQRNSLSVGEALTVNASFINNGVGAITLFFVPQEALLRDDGSPGLSFVVTRLADNIPLSEPTTVRPAIPRRTTFPVEVLHVLGPKQRCTEPLTFDATRLNNLGLSPGRYTVQAIYRNPFPGDLVIDPAATATPIFNDQGVYVVRELRSNTVDFSIGIEAPGQSGEAPPLGG